MVAILVALALVGEVSQAEIEVFAAKSQALLAKQMQQAQSELRSAKKLRGTARDYKKKAIETAAKKIADLEDPEKPVYAPLVLTAPKMHSVGHVGQDVELIQIVDKDSAIVRAFEEVTGARTGRTMRISAVDYWLSGIDTSIYVDGQDIGLSGVFAITGNKTYDAVAGGTKTIYALESVDMEKHKKLFIPPEPTR